MDSIVDDLVPNSVITRRPFNLDDWQAVVTSESEALSLEIEEAYQQLSPDQENDLRHGKVPPGQNLVWERYWTFQLLEGVPDGLEYWGIAGTRCMSAPEKYFYDHGDQNSRGWKELDRLISTELDPTERRQLAKGFLPSKQFVPFWGWMTPGPQKTDPPKAVILKEGHEQDLASAAIAVASLISVHHHEKQKTEVYELKRQRKIVEAINLLQAGGSHVLDVFNQSVDGIITDVDTPDMEHREGYDLVREALHLAIRMTLSAIGAGLYGVHLDNENTRLTRLLGGINEDPQDLSEGSEDTIKAPKESTKASEEGSSDNDDVSLARMHSASKGSGEGLWNTNTHPTPTTKDRPAGQQPQVKGWVDTNKPISPSPLHQSTKARPEGKTARRGSIRSVTETEATPSDNAQDASQKDPQGGAQDDARDEFCDDDTWDDTWDVPENGSGIHRQLEAVEAQKQKIRTAGFFLKGSFHTYTGDAGSEPDPITKRKMLEDEVNYACVMDDEPRTGVALQALEAFDAEYPWVVEHFVGPKVVHADDVAGPRIEVEHVEDVAGPRIEVENAAAPDIRALEQQFKKAQEDMAPPPVLKHASDALKAALEMMANTPKEPPPPIPKETSPDTSTKPNDQTETPDDSTTPQQTEAEGHILPGGEASAHQRAMDRERSRHAPNPVEQAIIETNMGPEGTSGEAPTIVEEAIIAANTGPEGTSPMSTTSPPEGSQSDGRNP